MTSVDEYVFNVVVLTAITCKCDLLHVDAHDFTSIFSQLSVCYLNRKDRRSYLEPSIKASFGFVFVKVSL